MGVNEVLIRVQVVWADACALGCATCKCQSNSLWPHLNKGVWYNTVCHYAPGYVVLTRDGREIITFQRQHSRQSSVQSGCQGESSQLGFIVALHFILDNDCTCAESKCTMAAPATNHASRLSTISILYAVMFFVIVHLFERIFSC
jgi:hypothetical protein